MLAVPKVNPEVWAKMTPPTRSKDIKLQKLEKFFSKATVSLGILTEQIVKEKGNEHPKEDNPKESHSSSMAKIAFDAIRFIGQAQQELHHLRRIEIIPVLNPEYRQLCTSQITATKLLFGDDLAKSIKDLNETNKMTGKLSHGFKGRIKVANKGKSFLGQRSFYNPSPHHLTKSHQWQKNSWAYKNKGKFLKKKEQNH